MAHGADDALEGHRDDVNDHEMIPSTLAYRRYLIIQS